MPTLFNRDHQTAILGPETAVQPGEPHDFTDEQVAAGIAGLWSEEDPRAGLEAEVAFKSKRDRKTPPEQDPAATGEKKEI